MNKFYKDSDSRKNIFILTTSGILVAAFVLIASHLGSVSTFLGDLFTACSSFVWGILFAIIVNSIASKIEAILPKKMKFKTRRFIGAMVSTILLILVVAAVFILLIPKLADNIADLGEKISLYASAPEEWMAELKKSSFLTDDMINAIYTVASSIVQSLWTAAKNFIPNLISATWSTVSTVSNFVIGFIVCLYLLIDKQGIAFSLRRFGLALLDDKAYEKARNIMYLSLEKFTKFFSGKILDSIIIGLLCFIAMMFINSEYAPLVSVIVGITNIIPFFGPFIGAVPCALLLLIVSPADALVFVIMVFALQQLDGNVIGPHILGDSVGLSSLWIMFAILVGGHYFGFFGMLLGVPVVSVLYYIVKEYCEERLKEKGIQ